MQLDALTKQPASHPRRKQFEKELETENSRIQREIRARTEAERKLDVYFEFRDHLVQTMKYLNTLFTNHCNNLESNANSKDSSKKT